jgi:hypothetical protein
MGFVVIEGVPGREHHRHQCGSSRRSGSLCIPRSRYEPRAGMGNGGLQPDAAAVGLGRDVAAIAATRAKGPQAIGRLEAG